MSIILLLKDNLNKNIKSGAVKAGSEILFLFEISKINYPQIGY